MSERHVSLESIVQRRPRGAQIGINARGQPGMPTPVILITHETTEEAIGAALDAIYRDGHVSEGATNDSHRAAMRWCGSDPFRCCGVRPLWSKLEIELQRLRKGV